MTLLPLAHLGHWYFFPLYALPVAIVLASAVATTLRERRAKRSGEEKRPTG
jgi:hypothetical protein